MQEKVRDEEVTVQNFYMRPILKENSPVSQTTISRRAARSTARQSIASATCVSRIILNSTKTAQSENPSETFKRIQFSINNNIRIYNKFSVK